MKKKSRWIAIAVAVVGLAVVGLAIAQEGPRNAPAQVRGERGLRGLDLTAEQLDKIDQLKMNHLKEALPLRTDIQIKEMELAALWRVDEPSAKKIIAKVKEIAGVRTRLEIAKVNKKLGVYNILTPEQREKAKRFPQGRRGRQRGRGMSRNRARGMRNQPRGSMRGFEPLPSAPPPEEP